MKRVEALAGPQGTLYGDSSQSGTLRFITNKPDPTAFSANVDLMMRTGSESAESYDVSGHVNIPMAEDKFALRLVGFSATDGGYIDNVFGLSPQLGGIDNADVVADDINDVDTSGARVAAKWFINESWSVTGSYLYQKTESHARNTYDPTVGDLQTVKFYNDSRDDEWSQLSLTIEGEFGDGFEFVSNTGYFDRETVYTDERSRLLGVLQLQFLCVRSVRDLLLVRTDFVRSGYDRLQHQRPAERPLYAGIPSLRRRATTTAGSSARSTRRRSEHWNFLTYTPDFENTLAFYTWTVGYGYTPSGGAPAWWESDDDTTWDQWAVFANLNYEFNENWSAEVGLRYFDQTMDRVYFVNKPFISAPGVVP